MATVKNVVLAPLLPVSVHLCTVSMTHCTVFDSLIVSIKLCFPEKHHHNRFMALCRDHLGEPVPEENFWTLWCKGRLTQADTPTIQLGATPSGLSSAHLHHPPIFTGQIPFLLPNQQCQSTEDN